MYNRKRRTITFLQLIIAIQLIAIFSCRSKGIDKQSTGPAAPLPAESIAEGRKQLQDGDLVLRTDLDLVSSSLRNFSETDKTFSHCGVAFFENKSWVVYHLIAGDENPSGIMKKEPFDSFVDPHRKSGFGIFRYQFAAEEAAKFSGMVHTYMAEKMHFDNLFDLATDDKLYCAEMVYKALQVATGHRILLKTTVKNNFRPKYAQYQDKQFKKFEYVALDNLYITPFCKEIKRYHYPQITLERGE